MSARPGRLRAVHEIDIPRPRRLEITTEPAFFETVNSIKAEIEHQSERRSVLPAHRTPATSELEDRVHG